MASLAEIAAGCSVEDLDEQLKSLRPVMTSVALRFAPNLDAAEDIVQNAFEKAVIHLEKFQGRSRFSTWLHRIVVNEALMWLRGERRRARRFLEIDPNEPGNWREGSWVEPDPEQQLSALQRAERVRACVRALPCGERLVLQRCSLGEVSYEQFFAETGIRPPAAKSRAFRARQRLRSLLVEV